MPDNSENARLGREVFLAKFGGDRAALAEHMSSIRSRQTRLMELGRLFEKAIEIIRDTPRKEENRN
jgi:hypothetical protein